MWSLSSYKVIFIAIGAVGVFSLFIPSVAPFIRLPVGESFSELYLLGPERLASGFPHNITSGTSYTIYIGVSNHMRQAEYYRAMVKFRNASEPMPNTAQGTASSLPALYSYNVVLSDGQVFETPLTFSFSNITLQQNASIVGDITVNGLSNKVNKSSLLDNVTNEYRYEIFVELWIYSGKNGDFVYHNRYVGLYLNATNVA